MPWLSWFLFAWLVLSPSFQVNLYAVRKSGIYSSTVLLMVVLAIAAWRVMRDPKLLPWRSRMIAPLIAMGITAVAAGLQGALIYDRTLIGQHRFALVQVYAVALVGLSLACSLAIAVLVRTAADIRIIRAAVVCATIVLVCDAFFRLPTPVIHWWPLAAGHGCALVTAWLLFEKHERWRDYAVGLAFVIASVTEVVGVPFFSDVPSQWLSGWIAISVPIALLIAIRFPLGTLRVALPALVLLAYWQAPQIERVYLLAWREGDFGRLTLWEDAIKLAFQRPLLGVGPGNYLDYIMRYGTFSWMLSSPHGNYQQILAEMGFVGLGFVLWLFGRALTLGWRIYRRAGDAFVRSIAMGTVCGLSGQLAAAFVGDFVIPNYHNGGYIHLGVTIYAWVMIGVLMALERSENARSLNASADAGGESR